MTFVSGSSTSRSKSSGVFQVNSISNCGATDRKETQSLLFRLCTILSRDPSRIKRSYLRIGKITQRSLTNFSWLPRLDWRAIPNLPGSGGNILICLSEKYLFLKLGLKPVGRNWDIGKNLRGSSLAGETSASPIVRSFPILPFLRQTNGNVATLGSRRRRRGPFRVSESNPSALQNRSLQNPQHALLDWRSRRACNSSLVAGFSGVATERPRWTMSVARIRVWRIIVQFPCRMKCSGEVLLLMYQILTIEQ